MMQIQFGSEGYRRFSEPLLCIGQNWVNKANVMGGTVIETELERLCRKGISQGEAKMLIKMGKKMVLTMKRF